MPVFKIHNFQTESDLCFALMPFRPNFVRLYEQHIKPVLEKAGFRVLKADDIYTPTVIVEDIWMYINKASLVIADVTNRNPNVFYELGVAHAIGKETIILTQNEEDIPFDLKHLRYFKYDDNEKGWESLRKRLESIVNLTKKENRNAEMPISTFGSDTELEFISEKPNIWFRDLTNLDEIKDELTQSVVLACQRPNLFPIGICHTFLFYGPPGCGKTEMACALANEIDAVLYSIDAASVMNKWLGESERNIRRLFANARYMAGKPVVILIEEVECFFGVRRQNEIGGEFRIQNQLVKEIDRVSNSGNQKIFVIGTSNRPWLIEGDCLRRFQKRIYFSIPDFEARRELFKSFVKDLRTQELDFDELSRKSEGLSYTQIKDVVMKTQLNVIGTRFDKRMKDTQVELPLIEMMDILKVLSEAIPYRQSDLLKYQKLEGKEI